MHAGQALIDPYEIFKAIALGSGMRVADLGCGRTGHFVFPASRIVGDTGVVYAVDVIKNILESIQSRVRSEGYGNVQTVWSDIERVGGTPIPTESVDVCFFVNVLTLVSQKENALEEASRITKRGGHVVVVEWEKRLGPIGPTPDKMVEPGAVERIAHEFGLTVTSKLKPGEYHYCLILKK